MAEEFLNEFSRARGGFDGEMQSETASSGSFFGGYSETFHGSDPEETSGFLMEPTAPASHLPLSSSTDWTQLLMCGSRVEENLQAMHQDHSSSRTHLFQESIMGIDQHGFIMDGLLNEEFPSQTSNRFVIEDLASHFSTANETKAKGSATKRNDGGAPALKKPRVETPSPLPSFKVRREKLGDRITALQQLVSPFGKTDTASVLYEAIEYIKLLHDQVGVLSTPYLKLGSTMLHKPTVPDKSSKKSEGPKRDLQSRGLCLVPISSTFSIINDATPDFWAPAFGTSYKLER